MFKKESDETFEGVMDVFGQGVVEVATNPVTLDIDASQLDTMDVHREKLAAQTFMKLDKDGNGGLSKEEFSMVLAKINPAIDEKGVEKAFKKAKVETLMDLAGFLRWCDKMFKKESDETFEGVMDVFGQGVVEVATNPGD